MSAADTPTHADLIEGWYGLSIFYAGTTLADAVAEGSDSLQVGDEVKQSIKKALAPRSHGSYMFISRIHGKEVYTVVQKLPTGGILGLLTFRDWGRNDPLEALQAAEEGQTLFSRKTYPITLRYLHFEDDMSSGLTH